MTTADGAAVADGDPDSPATSTDTDAADADAAAGDEPTDRLGDLGAFIRGQRQIARLSVRRLADLAGVSNPYLSQIERGLRKPSAEILQQLAQALKISVESLYVRAGFLTDRDRPAGDRSPTRDAIAADERLTDEQKQALLALYDRFTADAGD